MCVNDLLAQGAEPLFFLDYYATGKLDVEVARSVIAGIADGCKQAGCALIGGETAEMPGMYTGKDYDLAGFAVGAVERGEILPRTDVVAGDVLIGLPSSGVHSNGYSLVRRLVSEAMLKWDAPAPFGGSATLAQALLVPTRIYVKPILKAVRETGGVKALAHITGGGLSENLPRVLPDGIAAHVDLSAWKAPAVFGWLQQAGRLDDADMLRTFNCGMGMIAVVAKDSGGCCRRTPRGGRRMPRPHRRDRTRPRRQIASQGQGRSGSRAVFGAARPPCFEPQLAAMPVATRTYFLMIYLVHDQDRAIGRRRRSAIRRANRRSAFLCAFDDRRRRSTTRLHRRRWFRSSAALNRWRAGKQSHWMSSQDGSRQSPSLPADEGCRFA